jgi:hypothetical protein
MAISQGGPLGVAGVAFSPFSASQWSGVTPQGNTGGLVIPNAQVLPRGYMTLTYGDYQEPQLGEFSNQQNATLGLGILPNIELFGRLTNYTNAPLPGSIILNGIRDVSANVKVALPTPWSWAPQLAVGVNDLTGGAVNFKSVYAVATQTLGPAELTLGYAHGSASGRKPTFDGGFGGIALRIGETGISALAEHDGQQKHLGLRWKSTPIDFLGGTQIVGSLQRSFDAVYANGQDANASNFGLTLLMPLGRIDKTAANFKPSASQALPDIEAQPKPGQMNPTAEDRLHSLQKALIAVGLERVRVGLSDGILGRIVVIEFENHRYAHNEVDAVGLVLGLAAEMAPRGVQRVHAIALKEGLTIHETSVGVVAYRDFLRGGPVATAVDSLIWERATSERLAPTQWVEATPSPASRVRIEVGPDLNNNYGTEVGFDYSLAASIQATAPLWRGARLNTSYIVPVAHSSNTEPGYALQIYRQREGLKSVALQQSAWIGGQMLGTLAAGKYFYETVGVQAEATVFVPDSSDTLRLRAAGYDKVLNDVLGQGGAFSGSYRRMLSPTMSFEAGVQRYNDGSSGPSFEWNQWFGDVSLQLNYRRGGDRQFAGLQLSFPLTPRRGMAAGPVVVAGPSQFARAIRTMLTSADQPQNLVIPNGVRNTQLDTSLEVDALNSGRLGQRYFESQLPRMRDSFFLYARQQLD